MIRRILATSITLCGYWLVQLGMRIGGIKMHVRVVRRGQVYPVAWTSAHEQQPVNTVPPRGSN